MLPLELPRQKAEREGVVVVVIDVDVVVVRVIAVSLCLTCVWPQDPSAPARYSPPTPPPHPPSTLAPAVPRSAGRLPAAVAQIRRGPSERTKHRRALCSLHPLRTPAPAPVGVGEYGGGCGGGECGGSGGGGGVNSGGNVESSV